jgi:hypothetical protein
MPRWKPKTTKSTKFVRPTIANLANHERLVVARRRAGLTQEALLKQTGLTRRRYQRMEAGRVQGDAWERMLADHPHLGALVRSVETLDEHERCFLSRLRSGRKLIEVAAAIKYTPYWVGEMERGRTDAAVLVDYWAKQARAAHT